MTYHFDEIIDRTNTGSLKYDFAAERGKPDGILPLWVADMDFKSPPEVIAALTKRCEHGIYGYTDPKDDYYVSVHSWFSNRHSLDVQRDWTVVTVGVVFAINCAIRAYTREGDGVLVQKPVYYPFFKSVLSNNRRLVNNPLVNNGGRYEVDFADFEQKIVDEKVRLFILCSPHNPVGRVWSKDELSRMGGICKKHGVVVVSDEIHGEFALTRPHTPFWNAGEDFDGFSLVCTAPSKAFNQPGLQNANIFVKNPELKKRLVSEMHTSGYSNAGTFGLIGCKAAYDFGGEWLNALCAYIKGNIDFTKDYIAEHMPQIKVTDTEGTYLMWLDFRALGMTQAALDKWVTEKANLWLSGGTSFGEEGEGFQRINLATPRINVEQALLHLKSALSDIG